MPNTPIDTATILENQDWLHRFVYSIVHDNFLAEDIVQSTFEHALQPTETSKPHGEVRTWLGGIARNLSFQAMRSDRRRKSREEKVAIPEGAVLKYSSEIAEIFQIASQAVLDLPEAERIAIFLRHLNGWKPKEIAAELEVPVTETYRTLERGTDKVRDRLKTRYGADWKNSCLLALGLPRLVPSSTTPLIGSSPAHWGWIAASIAVLGGGLWLGFGQQDAIDPERNPVASLHRASAQASLSTGLVRTEETPVGSTIAASAGHRTASFQAIDDITEIPIPGATVIAEDQDPGSGRIQGTTDSQGRVTLELPTRNGEITVSFGSNTHSGWSFAYPLDTEGTTTLRLTKGDLVVGIETENGIPGLDLRVVNQGVQNDTYGWLTFPQISDTGTAQAFLVEGGEHHVELADRIPGIQMHRSFWVDDALSGQTLSFQLQSPTPLQLVAVDENGATLSEARYSLFEGDARSGGIPFRRLQELPSDQGILFLPYETWAELDSASILVEMEGYQPTSTIMNGFAPAPASMVLRQLETNPVTLTFEGVSTDLEEVHLIDQTLRQIPAELEIPSSLSFWDTFYKRPLQQTSNGQYLLPRVRNEPGGQFLLEASSTSGEIFRSKLFADSERRGSQLELELSPQLPNPLTVQLSGGPTESIPLLRSVRSGPKKSSETHWPEENGSYHLAAEVGDKFTLIHKDSKSELSFHPIVGPQGVPNDFELVIPDSSSLIGSIQSFDGSPLPKDCSIKASFLGSLAPLTGDTWKRTSLTYRIDPTQGSVSLGDCPPGDYRLEFIWNGLTVGHSVTAGEPFHWVIPAYKSFIFKVLEEGTGAPLTAGLYDTVNLNDWGNPTFLSQDSGESGFLIQAVLQDTANSTLAIASYGMEPMLIGNMAPGVPTTVFLKKGRTVTIPFESSEWSPAMDTKWTCDSWGSPSENRQPFIRHHEDRISCSYLPATAFTFVEHDQHDNPTGRTVLVDARGNYSKLGF